MPRICLIPGDGAGREVIPAAARVLAAALPSAEFVTADAGWDCYLRCGDALPPATLRAVADADATLFGATQSPTDGRTTGYRSPILALRKHFDLYANLRPTEPLLPGDRLNLLIVRENTEGLYSGRERRDGDTAIAERVITRHASERIAHMACQQAQRRAEVRGKAPHVTVVHKANVLKISDGLFHEACLDVAGQYPHIKVDEVLVDAAAMWLARDASRFDTLVTTNLFGDILSDLAAGLAGGLGVAPSANVGAGRTAVFEPVHGSAPDIAGRGIANPVGAILSGAMLLDHLGENERAGLVRRSVRRALESGLRTPDLGGSTSTGALTDAICRYVEADTSQS